MSGLSFQKSIETPGSEQHPYCFACAASVANAAAASGSDLSGGLFRIVAVDAAVLPAAADAAFGSVGLVGDPLVASVRKLAAPRGVKGTGWVLVVPLPEIERGAGLARGGLADVYALVTAKYVKKTL